jgi:SAM-dependent methyltransferase
MDALRLDFPAASFAAVYALNSLLHVPTGDLPDALRSIHPLLAPGGLFYLGMYGDVAREGVAPDDTHEHARRRRFFAFRTDEQMCALVSPYFALVAFHAIAVERNEPAEPGPRMHFQSLILRRA